MTEAETELSVFALAFPGGAAGVDADSDNPLARATRTLLDSGQRIVSAIPAVLNEDAGAAFWLGYFVLTEASRVVFFPGIGFPVHGLRGGFSNGGGRLERDFRVDHLTLEADRRTWHLTEPSRRQHQGGGRSLDVGDGRYMWFTFTCAGATDLRPVSARTVVKYRPVANEAEARAREGAFFAAVSNGAASPVHLLARPPGESVLHVAIAVAAPGAPPYNGDGMPLPRAAPGVTHIELPSDAQGAFGRLLLSSAVEIQILAAWLPGKILPGAPLFAYSMDQEPSRGNSGD